MVVFEAPMLLAMLMLQAVPAPPAARPDRRCEDSRTTEGFDCCFHLARWNSQVPLTPILLPSAQTRTDDERTTRDVTKR